MTIVLIGAPAAGKTRVGRRLAKRLNKPFVDTDREIVAEHGPIPEIFATRGEPYFRALERAAVEAALGTDAVVSLGGGAVLDPRTQSDLAGARVVLLTISREAVSERIANAKRPLITGIDAWSALVAERAELYDALADLRVETSFRKPEFVVDEILELLGDDDGARPGSARAAAEQEEARG